MARNVVLTIAIPRKSFSIPMVGDENVAPINRPSPSDKNHFGRFANASGFLNGFACLVSK